MINKTKMETQTLTQSFTEPKLAVYKCANSEPIIDYHIELKYWLDLIKNGSSTYPELPNDISDIRKLERHNPVYKTSKATLLPAICLHSPDGRLRNNIQSLTGYLFIDIDKELTKEQLSKVQPFILARYTSPGGVGTHIIMLVDGMSISNFNAEYKLIMQELDLIELYDEKVAHPSWLTYVSSDEHIYVNFECLTYQYVKKYNSEGVSNPYPNTVSSLSNKSRLWTPPLVEDNAKIQAYLEYDQSTMFYDIDTKKGYSINIDGKTYIKAFMPRYRKSIKIGSRAKKMNAFGYALRIIHPEINYATLNHHMTAYADRFFEVPLPAKELKDKINYVWSQPFDLIKTELYKTKKKDSYEKHNRKIFWSTHIKYKPGEKKRLLNEALKELHRNRTYAKITKGIELIIDSDVKTINQKMFAKHSNMSRDTVRKYWDKITVEFNNYLSLQNG